MKKMTLLIFTAIIIPLAGISQYNFDFGIKLGAANYLGDIGGEEETARRFIMDMKLSQTNLAFGGYARYKFNGYFAVSGGFNYTKLSGDDQLSSNPGRYYRNLRFKNNVWAITAKGEFYVYEMNDVGGKGRYWVDMKTYVFAGLSAFHHNPQGQIYGDSEWYDLQPLQTEGVEYGNWGIGIPVGAGIYFTYKRKHRFGYELTWTTTFTDYLDDISTVYADPATLQSDLARDLANQTDLITDDPTILAQYGPPSEETWGRRGDPDYDDAYLHTTLSYGYLIRGKSNFYTQNYGFLSGRKKSARKVRAKF